jgi:RNA polymerase sigma-70 factor (ECF subfamily)
LNSILADLQTDPTDQEAWADLYRQLWPYVLHLSFQRLGSRAGANDAEDLAQEVFMRLSNALHTRSLQLPKNESTFRSLLAVMTRNRAMDFLRLARRQVRDTRRNEPLVNDICANDSLPDSVVEEHDLFFRLLAGLDPLQQKMLWLLVEGQTQAEIADELGISVRTMQRHLQTVRTLYSKLRIIESL